MANTTPDQIIQAARDLIWEHFKEGKHPADKIDFALRSQSVEARLKGTERIKDGTQYAVIRDISENKQELKKYLAVSLPHLNPVKSLKKCK